MTDIFINQKHLQEICSIIKGTYPNATIWAYGSRVGGDAHNGSDLDLVVKDFGQDGGNIYELKEAFSESNLPFLIDILEFDRLPQSFQKEIKKKYVVIYNGKFMMFDDTKLFKSDGSFDFGYALKWFHSVKDPYDLADFFNDMKDIENLLNASPEDIAAIERKSDELKLKYCIQVGAVNLLNALRNGYTTATVPAKKQLQMFEKHLPILELMKAGLSKLLQSCVDAYLNQTVEKLTSEFSAMFQQNHATEEEIKKT